MALNGTYAGLKASIADFLGRGDLAAAIPDFIILAEAQMARRFAAAAAAGLPVPRRLVVRADTTLAAGAEFVGVPGRFIGPRTFILQTDPVRELSYLSPETFTAAKKKLAFDTGDLPQYYTVIGEELQVMPAPPVAAAAEMTYLAAPMPLSVSNPENWVLSNYPDIYLYGALVQSAPYLDADERLSTWGTIFTQAIADACNADPLPTDKTQLRADVPRGGNRYVLRTDI
jgi:hypothetical protein